MRKETEVAVAETSAVPEFEGNLEVFEPRTDKSADSADLTPSEGMASQPARQAWSPEVADLSPTEETQLLAEIRLLFESNKRNRFALGEKLWYLREGTKHGEWLKKVEDIGIKDRTARALISYYCEERDRPPVHFNADEPMPFDLREGTSRSSMRTRSVSWLPLGVKTTGRVVQFPFTLMTFVSQQRRLAMSAPSP